MAFGRFERGSSPQPMSDINMTPLIDVMLVLLVIFIITAPLMSNSLRLDLPKSDAARPSDTPAFMAVSVDPQGRLFMADKELDAAALAERVAELIGIVQKGGLTRIGFVAQNTAAGAPR